MDTPTPQTDLADRAQRWVTAHLIDPGVVTAATAFDIINDLLAQLILLTQTIDQDRQTIASLREEKERLDSDMLAVLCDLKVHASDERTPIEVLRWRVLQMTDKQIRVLNPEWAALNHETASPCLTPTADSDARQPANGESSPLNGDQSSTPLHRAEKAEAQVQQLTQERDELRLKVQSLELVQLRCDQAIKEQTRLREALQKSTAAIRRLAARIADDPVTRTSAEMWTMLADENDHALLVSGGGEST